jgi:hypothetical protein
MSRAQEHLLRPNTSTLARRQSLRGTAVLPLRLTAAEIAALESVARRTGKTVSQIVREALSSELSRSLKPLSH